MTTCCETRRWAAGATSRPQARDWPRSRGSGCRWATIWHIPRRCRNSDCRRRRRCPTARTPDPAGSAADSPRATGRKGTPPADICRGPSDTKRWAWHPGRSKHSFTSSPWLPSRIGQAEETLLEDRVPAIPEGQGEAETALAIGDPQQSRPLPSGRPGCERGRGENTPRHEPSAGVVLAHGAPLALGQIGAPPFPVFLAPGVGREPFGFGVGLLSFRHSAGIRSVG